MPGREFHRDRTRRSLTARSLKSGIKSVRKSTKRPLQNHHVEACRTACALASWLSVHARPGKALTPSTAVTLPRFVADGNADRQTSQKDRSTRLVRRMRSAKLQWLDILVLQERTAKRGADRILASAKSGREWPLRPPPPPIYTLLTNTAVSLPPYEKGVAIRTLTLAPFSSLAGSFSFQTEGR